MEIARFTGGEVAEHDVAERFACRVATPSPADFRVKCWVEVPGLVMLSTPT